MVDPRIKKLADVLVNHSVHVKKGETVSVNFGIDAKELALEVHNLILKLGAFPITRANVPGFSYNYYKLSTIDMLKKEPKFDIYKAKNVDAFINISSEYNTKEFSNIDPKKIVARKSVLKPISEIILKKDRWVICEFPTHSIAQDADMSLEEFEDFLYSATNIDWNKLEKREEVLKNILDKGKNVRILGEDTDISFSIKGRQAIKSFGTRNMPDGEVFIGPVETSTKGYVKYSFPAIYNGREVEGISLKFNKGKVVEAKAKKNEAFLKEMLKIDPGASYLGEFGIGLNYNIDRFVKQIIFDEKMGGTIHLALGMAYKKGGGKNESALHWDMIKDLRQGGEIWVDDLLIQKNGKFRIKF